MFITSVFRRKRKNSLILLQQNRLARILNMHFHPNTPLPLSFFLTSTIFIHILWTRFIIPFITTCSTKLLPATACRVRFGASFRAHESRINSQATTYYVINDNLTVTFDVNLLPARQHFVKTSSLKAVAALSVPCDVRSKFERAAAADETRSSWNI